ncbi:MAG: DUF2141 domain-containing protein [Myxococcota bacterium]
MWWLIAAASAHELSLEVSGLRGEGTVRAGAYADAASWLSEDGEVGSCVAPVEDGRAVCRISVPSPGQYAVAFFHDADGDGAFDKSLLGLPREGFGFSRDAPTGLTGPSFADAALWVRASAVSVVARARYSLTGG